MIMTTVNLFLAYNVFTKGLKRQLETQLLLGVGSCIVNGSTSLVLCLVHFVGSSILSTVNGIFSTLYGSIGSTLNSILCTVYGVASQGSSVNAKSLQCFCSSGEFLYAFRGNGSNSVNQARYGGVGTNDLMASAFSFRKP